jgi:hypothetical protein
MAHKLSELLDVVMGATALYYVYKHYTLSQIMAAVKAEMIKIEGELASGSLTEEVKIGYAVLVARIKALL